MASLMMAVGSRVSVAAFDPLTDLTWAHYHDSHASFSGTADATAVSSWPDLSGNNRHATQATGTKQPSVQTVSGTKVIRGDGGDALQITGVDLAASSKATIYLVCNQTTNGVTTVIYEQTANAGTVAKGIGVYRDAIGNVVDATVANDTGGGNNFESLITASTLQSTPKLIVLRVDNSLRRGKALCFVNGKATVGSYSAETTAPGTALANATVNLMARNAASSFMTGDFYFAATASGRHTTSQVNQMTSYLAGRFALSGVSLFEGVLVFDGESNVDSLDGSAAEMRKVPYPQVLGARFANAYDIHNDGYGGKRMDEQLSEYPTKIAPLYDAGVDHNIYMIHGGQNDLAQNQTKENVWDDLEDLTALARATGWTVLAGTMAPCCLVAAWTGGCGGAAQVEYDTVEFPWYNQKLRDEFVQNGHGDAVVDFQAKAELVDETNTTYYLASPDQCHWTGTGHGIAADAVEAVLDVLGVT